MSDQGAIYFASSLAKKCMPLYQTYINMMNDHIRRRFATGNPFCFKHISTIKSVEQFDDVGPCVMFASPGMLQSGLSRELLELWCPSKKNGVIIAGYCVEGTLARQILAEPSEIVATSGAKIPMRMEVDYISFSAHVDFPQNSAFMEAVAPSHIILVHGEQGEMARLKSAMLHRLPPDRTQIHTPRNCEQVILEFRGEKYATVVGKIADTNAPVIEGLIVGKDFEYEIVDIDEIKEYTPLSVIRGIQQTVRFGCSAAFSLLEWHIIQLFGKDHVSRVLDSANGTLKALQIMNGALVLQEEEPGHWIMRWTGSVLNDMIADAVAAVAVHAEISRSSVKMTLQSSAERGSCCHGSKSNTCTPGRGEILRDYLKEFYENVALDQDCVTVRLNVNGDNVMIDAGAMVVLECENEENKLLVQRKLDQIKRVMTNQ